MTPEEMQNARQIRTQRDALVQDHLRKMSGQDTRAAEQQRQVQAARAASMARLTANQEAQPKIAADGAAKQAGRGAVREIARGYSLGRDALARHAANHIDSAPASQEATAPAETSQSVTSEVERMMPLSFAPVDTAPAGNTMRDDVVQYIQTRLGPDLGKVYVDAIRSSVGTGCYDREWEQGEPYMRIERYLDILKKDWMSHQGDLSGVMERLIFMLSFCIKEQRQVMRE